MNSPILVPGVTISPTAEDSIISEAQRVLYIEPSLDLVVLIPIQPARYASRLYYKGYSPYNLSDLRAGFEADIPTLRVIEATPRAITLLTDNELDQKFRRNGQTKSTALKQLERRWSIIEPIVNLQLPVQFNKKSLVQAVTKLAEEHWQTQADIEREISRILQYLHQFWAGGSLRGALMTFHDLCGGRGKPHHPSDKKLGRPNRLTKSGLADMEGFICDEKSIRIIQFCWRNFVIRNQTVSWACRKMWRDFYYSIETGSDGKSISQLLPVQLRPTEMQFRYWGQRQEPNQEAWKKQLKRNDYQRNWRALPGSANDDVVAVGQRAAVDSTPPDLQLVSILSRLKPIGGAYRIIVVDCRYGYIPGFYLGIEAPSSKTVKLAFLHALSDKTQWLQDLGLDIPAEDWLPIAFTQAIADNTDLRTEDVKTTLHSIGTSIMFVPKYRSDLNSEAEATHHSLHRSVDHHLLGTTHGHRTERGEQRADLNARLTIIEAIRETARAIHIHNTMELDIFRPLAMREAGVKPTRLAMTSWEINQGKVARTGMDIQTARMKLLPICKGCFTKYGVKLLRWDTGDKRVFIEPLRYVSKHIWVLQQMESARRGGKQYPHSFDIDVRYDPFNLRHIFIYEPDQYGLIQLDLKIKDPDLPEVATIDDVIDIQNQDGVDKFFITDHQDIARSKLEAEQDETNRIAEQAYQDQLSQIDKKPSKTAFVKNKRENREEEVNVLRDGMPLTMNSEVQIDNDGTISEEYNAENAAIQGNTQLDEEDLLALALRRYGTNQND